MTKLGSNTPNGQRLGDQNNCELDFTFRSFPLELGTLVSEPQGLAWAAGARREAWLDHPQAGWLDGLFIPRPVGLMAGRPISGLVARRPGSGLTHLAWWLDGRDRA